MPKALAVPIRQQIVKLKQEGKSYLEIANELGQSRDSVRKIWRRYQEKGEQSLVPSYERCGQKESTFEKLVWRSVRYLKRLHPSWGAGFIRVKLSQRWPQQKLPHVRTMQRWFNQAGITSAREQPKRGRRERARIVHQCWQVDAVCDQRLGDGSEACWLSTTDEASGAVLSSTAFPLWEI